MQNKTIERAEKWFAVIGLTFFTRAFDLGTGIIDTPLLPGFFTTALRYVVWLGSLFLIFAHRKDAMRTASREKLLWVLTLIILLSFIWSDFPLDVFKNNREVWQMTSFSLYFATRFSLKEQIKLIVWTFVIGAFASIFLALTVPIIAIHQEDHPGAWRGVYDYKNTFGSMMIIGSLALFLLPVKTERQKLYRWAGIILLLIMMLLSTSKTSLVIYFLLVLILGFYRNFRWQGRVTVVILDLAILILACVATLVVGNWVALLTGLGKDPTLTGRTILWATVLMRLGQRPLLGYGRGAFWSPQAPYGQEAGRAVSPGFVAPHSHNGFFDIALDVGYIGLLLFLIIYFRAFFLALKRAYATKNSENLWPLAFLMFLAMNNVTESYLLRISNIYWVLFLTVVLSVNPKPPVTKQIG